MRMLVIFGFHAEGMLNVLLQTIQYLLQTIAIEYCSIEGSAKKKKRAPLLGIEPVTSGRARCRLTLSPLRTYDNNTSLQLPNHS